MPLQDNPLLLRNNFPIPIAGKGGISYQSPAEFLAANPKTDGANAITVGGTVADDDTAQITITHALLPNGSKAFQVTAATDTADSIAVKLATAINLDATMRAFGISATVVGAIVTVRWPGAIAKKATITVAVTGTTTLTRNPTSGLLSSAAGPVTFSKDFDLAFGGTIQNFFAGYPYNVDDDLLTALVNASAPIY